MSRLTGSISFQEDFFLWTEQTLSEDKIEVKRAVSESLPVIVNHQSINQPVSIRQIANQLKAVAQKYELNGKDVSLSIPTRYWLIKSIGIPEGSTEEEAEFFVYQEMASALGDAYKEFKIFAPGIRRNALRREDLLVAAIRKELIEFFEKVGSEAELSIQSLTPAAFGMDELLQRFSPDLPEDAILVGWQRRGMDITIVDSNGFKKYLFKPYNQQLDEIEKLEVEEILSGFENMIEEIQQPRGFDKPLFKAGSIYLYGFHFNPEWLTLLEAQVSVPINILEPSEKATLLVENQDDGIEPENLFKFYEPVSTILATE
ncbi:MAG: hypothetical protein Kow0037_16760 [Calditrichia bacterium]